MMENQAYMTKQESVNKSMRIGGFIDDLPMEDEMDEIDNPRNTHYQFVESRFRPPTGAEKSPAQSNKTPSKGSMRQFAEPSAPSRLDAQKLWPGERSPDGPDHAQTPAST